MIAKFAGLYPHVKHVLCCSIIIIHVAVRPSFQLSQSLSLSLTFSPRLCVLLVPLMHCTFWAYSCSLYLWKDASEVVYVQLCVYATLLSLFMRFLLYRGCVAVKLFKCATYTTNLPLSSQKLREFKRFRPSIRPSQCLNPLRSCALYSFLFCIFAVYFRSFFFVDRLRIPSFRQLCFVALFWYIPEF